MAMDLRPGDFLAPDGIIIRPVPGAGSELVSVVVGIIPPNADDYPVHYHGALEQVTYVLRGSVVALFQGPAEEQPWEVTLGVGQAVTTPPATTLSFRNHGTEPAEVLFICVPSYPATNADTYVIGTKHRPLERPEMARAVQRMDAGRAMVDAVLRARADSLRWLMTDHEPRPTA
ncbi:MAG: cupin domain-containing protein [Chloroflexota bacterium]